MTDQIPQYILDAFRQLTPEEQDLVIAYAELLRDQHSDTRPPAHPR